MGGDLHSAPEGEAPTFLVAAIKDPYGGNLDRIQIIKGWLDAASGEPQEKVDAQVSFSSWATEPAPGVGTTDFSVIWIGQVEPAFSETYTFYARYDDGARLWVDGQLLVDDWTGGGSRENSGTVTMQAGQKYHVAMQYYQAGGGGVAELSQ